MQASFFNSYNCNVSVRALLMTAIGLGINLGMGIGAIPYLFRDEFTTSESAPLASPRTAEPGPGTLTCVQTDGELSIVGGKLVFPVQTTPTWADQGYHTGSIARAAGTLILSQINVDLATKTVSATCQKTASLASAQRQYELGFSNTDLNKWADDGIGGLQVGDFVAATDYQVLFVLRATGAHFLIKGGIYTDWTLLWVDANGTAAVFCGLSNYNASGTQEYFRIPAELWTPTPLASDSFDRANSTSFGNTDGAGVEESGGSGIAWTESFNNQLEIVSNAAESISSGSNLLTLETSETDVLIAARGTAVAGGYIVIVGRYVDDNNFWSIYSYQTNGTLYLYEITGGTWTTRASDTATHTAGVEYVVTMIFAGDDITAYRNGGRASYTSSQHNTATKHGLACYTDGDRVLSWACWPREPSEVPDV
jgi:hypothetical protein